MDRPRALGCTRNRRGPSWDYRRPECARPGHHVYGDVAPRSLGGNAPRLKRRQQRTTRDSTSFFVVSVPLTLPLTRVGTNLAPWLQRVPALILICLHRRDRAP